MIDTVKLKKKAIDVNSTISIIIAKLSYAWLEKPFLKLKDKFAVVKTQLA